MFPPANRPTERMDRTSPKTTSGGRVGTCCTSTENGGRRPRAAPSSRRTRRPARCIESVADAGVDDVRAASGAAAAAFGRGRRAPRTSGRRPLPGAPADARAARGAGQADDRASRASRCGWPATRWGTRPTSCSGSPRRPSASTATTIPSARGRPALPGAAPAGGRGRRDHAVELPDVDAHPEDRARRSRPAARSCSSRPSRRRCRGRGVQDLRGDRAFPRAWSTSSPPREPETVGDELVTNPLVRKITFTGSTEVGKLHRAAGGGAASSASAWSSGGHAPFIVFDDADPVHAAKGAAAVKFLNTGQACICPNRMLRPARHRRAVRRHARASGSTS